MLNVTGGQTSQGAKRHRGATSQGAFTEGTVVKKTRRLRWRGTGLKTNVHGLKDRRVSVIDAFGAVPFEQRVRVNDLRTVVFSRCVRSHDEQSHGDAGK